MTTKQRLNELSLLHQMLALTGLRVRQRPDGERWVYLTSRDLESSEIAKLEAQLRVIAPKSCYKRLYMQPKCRAKSIAKAILQLNAINPVISRCQLEKVHTMRYELGLLDLEQHGKYIAIQ